VHKKIKELVLNKKIVIFSVFSLIIPFVIYLLTLERKLIGGDTSWYALEIPKMQIFVPTGYPTFSMLGKLITYLPIGDLAYRLNLFSAIFGALTILFLFLSINRLIKNEAISLISSLVFAFILPFWHVANRLEFDTLNSFFIILLIFSAIRYSENKTRKYLYYFFFCLGLSLTNHPIAFFVVPALLLYVVIVNPKIFKSVKAIFISILFFVLPLLSYLYLPIRSLQGYGEVTSLQKLFYYVTGRKVTGELHGGHFGNRAVSEILGVIKDYLLIVYNNFGIVLIIISVAGFIFLIKRNWKFGICSFLLIIFNFIVPPLYLPYANSNYALDAMLVITIYIAFGFLLILNTSNFLLNKSLNKRKILKVDNFLKYFMVTVIFLFFAFQPASFIYASYGKVDLSEPEDVYKFWDEAFDNMEDESKIYVRAKSTNIGMFVNRYEYGKKEITYVYHNSSEYTAESMIEALDKNIPVYFVGNSGTLRSVFNTEQIGKTYFWDRYNETLRLFKVVSPIVNIKISCSTDNLTQEFGKKFTIEYAIRNKNKESIKISSLELELPDNIELIGVRPDGYINQQPGISRGIYMWVSDSYIIEGESKINLIVELRGIRPGKSTVKFRATTHEKYVNCDDIEIEIKG